MPAPFAPVVLRVARFVSNVELAVLALTAPFLVFPNALTGAAFALLLATWVARWIARGRLTLPTPLGGPIALLLTMTVMGAVASVDMAASWPKLWGVLLGVVVYFGLVNGLHTVRALKQAASLLLVLGVGVALFSLLVTDWKSYQFYNLTWVTDRIPTFPDLARVLPSGGVGRQTELLHPREGGGTMALLFPLSLSLLLLGQGRATRSLAAVATVAFGSTLVLSQALSAVAGAVLAMVLLAIWRYRQLVWVGLPMLAVAAVVGRGTADAILATENKVGAGLAERVVIWMWGLEALRHQPFTGVGLNSFDYVLSGLFREALIPGIYHAHNLFLQMALDTGLPGLGAFLWLLIACARRAKRALCDTTDATLRAVVLGGGLGVLAFLVFGVVDAISLGAKPGVAFWAILGLMSAVGQRGQPLDQPRAPWLRRFAMGLSAAALMGGILLLFPGVRALALLNLGTAQANKALIEVRSTGRPNRDSLQDARRTLQQVEASGWGTAHTEELLGSMNGWLGDCDQTYHYFKQTAARGGVVPVGATLLGGGTGSAPSGDLIENPLARHLDKLRPRLGLPQTPESLYHRYYYHVIELPNASVTRWGQLSQWWEPYLLLAILAEDWANSSELAAAILRIGLERAAFTAPLACYGGP